MSRKTYKLRVLPLFEQNLNEIVDYICGKLKNPTAAYALVDAVEQAINERLPFAESFEVYPSEKERKYPYYRINVKNYTVFYVVIGDVMEVRRILYSRSNYSEKI